MGDMNFSLTTFNKTGKLMQIEHALNRVQQGKMSLGVKGKRSVNIIYLFILIYDRFYPWAATNGVVIVTDKKVGSVLVDDSEYHKIQNITPSTGNKTQTVYTYIL